MALQLLHREETVNNQMGRDMTLCSGKILKATEREENKNSSRLPKSINIYPFSALVLQAKGNSRKR